MLPIAAGKSEKPVTVYMFCQVFGNKDFLRVGGTYCRFLWIWK